MNDHHRGQEKTPLENEVLANLSPEGQHKKRISRYSSAKTKQEEVLSHILTRNREGIKPNLSKEALALADCGSFIIFRRYYTVDIYKMVGGCTCKKHLLCALCAIRRGAKYISVYSKKIESVLVDSEVEYDKVMITFTIKNGEDISERFNHLIGGMGKLLQKRRDSLKKKPKTDTVMKHVSSAVYSYEVTWSEETGFHPHVHMIALIPKGLINFKKSKIKGKSCFVPWEFCESLSQDWKAITGDSHIIDVRRIEAVTLQDPGTETGISDMMDALCEVFKYALKMNDMDVEIQVDTYEALKGRRLIGSFGALYGIKVSKNLNDEPLSDEELPYIDLLYQYSGETFGYQKLSEGQFDLEAAPRAMLDLKNRIDENKRKGTAGHFTRNVDNRNDFDAAFNEDYVKDWSKTAKIKETPVHVAF